MEPDAKVKYLGLQVGKVSKVEYDGNDAQLTLAIRSDQMDFIPVQLHRADRQQHRVWRQRPSNSFRQKRRHRQHSAPGAHLQAGSVSVEVNTLFQTLVNTLHKINPVELNATLTAVSTGLRDNGDNLGATLAGLNTFLTQINPKLPTLQSDLQKTADVADIYADAAPDLVTVLDNTPTISDTIVDSRDDLNATLLAATGLADNGYQTVGARRERLRRRRPEAARPAEGTRRLLAGVRLHLQSHLDRWTSGMGPAWVAPCPACSCR